jgi:hypothetical protein
MDLNAAIEAAKAGKKIVEPSLMREGWTVQFDKKDGKLYYHRPTGEQAHKIVFLDQHRASFQWSIVDEPRR